MNTNEIITRTLALYHKQSIDNLPDEALLNIIDMMTLPDYGGATAIYEESNEEERKALIDDVKRCVKGKAKIEYYLVNDEGVENDENKEYFDFCSRHSVWYDIIAI